MDEIVIGATESLTPREQRPLWADQWTGPLPPVMIRLREEALRDIDDHASATFDEVGGLLLGGACSWEGTLYVDVEVALAGERTEAGPTHVTFTADTWAALIRRQEREHPERWVVGWYHSHPRMGVFLSDLDLALHRHFFTQPWHVALVINGQDRLMGLFGWSGQQIAPVREFVWSRGQTNGSAAPLNVAPEMSVGEPATVDKVPPNEEKPEAQSAAATKRMSPWNLALALFAGGLVLAYLLNRATRNDAEDDA